MSVFWYEQTLLTRSADARGAGLQTTIRWRTWTDTIGQHNARSCQSQCREADNGCNYLCVIDGRAAWTELRRASFVAVHQNRIARINHACTVCAAGYCIEASVVYITVIMSVVASLGNAKVLLLQWSSWKAFNVRNVYAYRHHPAIRMFSWPTCLLVPWCATVWSTHLQSSRLLCSRLFLDVPVCLVPLMHPFRTSFLRPTHTHERRHLNTRVASSCE